MENMKRTANLRNPSCVGKQTFLPPKSPFPVVSPAYADYGSSTCVGSKDFPKPRDGLRHHQRTSSESFLMEEQPSWLDDLLNEPEMPVRRGAHRRSSSDSFAYLDMGSISSNIGNPSLVGYGNRSLTSFPSLGSQESDRCNDWQYASYYTNANNSGRPQNRGWRTLNSRAHPSHPKSRSTISNQCLRSPGYMSEPDTVTSPGAKKQDQDEPAPHNTKGSSERNEGPHAKHSQPDTDQKRVNQQFAQRSRVRKLQYIAELERNVQALQAEGSEVSAELQFFDQQNIILSMENEALRQQVDSLAQEQLIKRVQQEMLEREIARLGALFQQQQQQSAFSYGRGIDRDLDSQFANLSLKHKEANTARDTVPASLHT